MTRDEIIFNWLRYVPLNPERLDWCAEGEPWGALIHAADRLSPERLDWCAEQCSDWFEELCPDWFEED